MQLHYTCNILCDCVENNNDEDFKLILLYNIETITPLLIALQHMTNEKVLSLLRYRISENLSIFRIYYNIRIRIRIRIRITLFRKI